DRAALAPAVPGGEGPWVDTVAPEPPDDDILRFPRGAAAGECLHRLFELSRFTEPESWPRAALGALHDRPVEADPELATRLPAMMVQLVDDVVRAELVPGMRLADLDPAKRLDEMGFLFPAPSLDLTALRRLLVAHGYPDVALEAGTLAGFIKGFIDMI
ncbi:exodeoxyribonuclease V subunit beta, partial [Pseudomonas sp. MWU13-2625]